MRRAALPIGALAIAALVLALTRTTDTGTAAGATAAQPPTSADYFEPELGLPATGVVAFGSSQEGSGEVWAYGELGQTPIEVEGKAYSSQEALLERSDTSKEWAVMPLPELEGEPLAPQGAQGGVREYGALAGQATSAGGVVLLTSQRIVVRDPGEHPCLAPSLGQASGESPKEGECHGSGEAGKSTESGGSEGANVESEGASALAAGESLLPPVGSKTPTVPFAAVEEGEGRKTGILIAPYDDGGKQSPSGQPAFQPGVLRYDGKEWTRENVEGSGEEIAHFTALALSCAGTQAAPESSSPENCWLLAAHGTPGSEKLSLYRRVRSSSAPSDWSWRLQPVSDWMLGSEPRPAGVSSVNVAPLPQGGQMLTATSQGVWVDFDVYANGQPAPVNVSELVQAPGAEGERSKVAGTWCYPTGTVCQQSLGAPLPTHYRSFAWSGASSTKTGTRVITGLQDRAMLELSGGNFTYMVGDGGQPGFGAGGAAFYTASAQGSTQGSVEGLIADGEGPTGGEDSEGQSQAIGITSAAPDDQLTEESVPFRHPLLAVTQAPGTAPGDPNAEALAVGAEGEIGRYVPGQGWRPEALYNSEGKAQTATLRGVAWPEPRRAYAVGDNGTMWLWTQENGYWVPDPAKPFNFIGSLTAIAFEPGNPQLGYAVGKEGALLKYGKSWEELSASESATLEHELGVEEWRLNFTSVAFAGSQAIASYRYVTHEGETEIEAGGLLINEGSGWHRDSSAAALLSAQPALKDTVISKVAGLSDGGAVAAGPDLVIERESAGAPWHLSQTPLPEAQNISALAAYRESGGPVRAIVSIDLDPSLNPNMGGVLRNDPFGGDVPAVTSPEQPPPFIPPDPLPDSGYVVKEAASGWTDMEHEALPARTGQVDVPVRPDPVLAMEVSGNGQQGLAVGGQTYDEGGYGDEPKGETAGLMRFPAGTGAGQAAPVSIAAPSGQASFVVGGEASCEERCADLANESIGSDVWLTHALSTAGRIEGARAFLYVGSRTTPATGNEAGEIATRELTRFEGLLGAAGSLPVYVDPSTFKRVLTTGATPTPCGCGANAYSLLSAGAPGQGGLVKVIALDYSAGALGTGQKEWLERELKAAYHVEEPSIVMGRDALSPSLPNGPEIKQAPEAEAVAKILVEQHASAYVFDYTGVNMKTTIRAAGGEVPAFGTGTLGANEATTENELDDLHSSAFLLLSVEAAADPTVAKPWNVTAKGIPNIGQLSLNATNGVLLRRSQPAIFEGLARRPPAGLEIGSGNGTAKGKEVLPSVYDPIPHNCQGTNCPYEVPLEYTFTSSNPDVGGFVEHEAASSSAAQVQLNAKNQPIPDEPRDAEGALNAALNFNQNGKGESLNERGEVVAAEHSALFCAYNEGTTVVTITAGGLSYSMPVTVQGGSAEHPCGTVPLRNPPPRYEASTTPLVFPNPSTPLNQAPLTPQLQSIVPPPPPPVITPVAKHTPPRPTVHAPLLQTPATLFPLPVLVPPPAPNLARPTPPSGTAQVPSQSPVAQQVSVAEREKEVESATQHVHNMAAYGERHESESMPTWSLGLIVIAAAAAAGVRPRRRRGEPVYAWNRARRGPRR